MVSNSIREIKITEQNALKNIEKAKKEAEQTIKKTREKAVEEKERIIKKTRENVRKQHQKIEDDAIFLSLCTNVTAETLENYRDAIRSLFIDLYAAQEIYLDNVDLLAGLSLFVQSGVLTQESVNLVLA